MKGRTCITRLVSLFAPNSIVFNNGAREIFYAMNTMPAMLAVRIGWVEVT